MLAAKDRDGMVEVSSVQGPDGVATWTWSDRSGWEPFARDLAREEAVTIYLDKVELATLMCTPEKLNFLVVGFLRSEGLIERLDDIAMMRVCAEESGVVDVRLMQPRQPSGKRILTSGCGGGLSFDEGWRLRPVVSDLRIAPAQLLDCMRLLQSHSLRTGMHVSALSDGKELLIVSRDIGRHNTLDKIWGECLFREIPTEGRILLTTGRLSSEMTIKAAKMGVPMVVSMNSPTTRTVSMARDLGVTVVGYARGSRLTVYCHSERLCPSFMCEEQRM